MAIGNYFLFKLGHYNSQLVNNQKTNQNKINARKKKKRSK